MLTSLNIRNFVLIKSLELEFHSGFTTLTGETGTGKSILIDALQMLFGARSDVGTIRHGEEKSELSASFTLNKATKEWLVAEELDTEEDELIIRRTLDRSGRSRSWINGTSVTTAQLKELSQRLVFLHGQHAYQSLTRKNVQLDILDHFGSLENEVEATKKAWQTWRTAQHHLAIATQEQEVQQAEKERLSWFLEDIESLKPEKNEWESLNEEHARLSRYTEILQAGERAKVLLKENEESALELVDNAISSLEFVSDADKSLEEIVTILTDARELLDDASKKVEHYLSRLDYDEARYEELDERISTYLKLAHKYHIEPAELYVMGLKAQKKWIALEEICNISALETKCHESEALYYKEARQLSQKRQTVAKDLSEKVSLLMQSLAMVGSRFVVSITEQKTPTSTGLDNCEFLVSSHSSLEAKPLSKVASGGELARISLAIAVTNSTDTTVDTLIFDEVDTGIGGAVAEIVGELLKKLGVYQQVLCVTHLPQVASCADYQFQITKKSGDETQSPESSARPLTQEERIQEIARMLGGVNITETTLQHAKEMLGFHNENAT